jgi:predicted transcriptional regulator
MSAARQPLKTPGRARRKATTLRLEPRVQERLTVLAKHLQQPLNKLINEAVRGFIEKRSIEVEADLQESLRRLQAYRTADPDFESAIAEFAEAETRLASEDPAEGQAKPSAAGPAQLMVRELLGG